MTPWDMGINIDFSYGRTTYTDIILADSLVLVVTIVPGGNKGLPMDTALVGSKVMDNNMEQEGAPGHWNEQQQESWISTQTLASIGSGSEIWPLAATQPRHHHHHGPSWKADLPLNLLLTTITMDPSAKQASKLATPLHIHFFLFASFHST